MIHQQCSNSCVEAVVSVLKGTCKSIQSSANKNKHILLLVLLLRSCVVTVVFDVVTLCYFFGVGGGGYVLRCAGKLLVDSNQRSNRLSKPVPLQAVQRLIVKNVTGDENGDATDGPNVVGLHCFLFLGKSTLGKRIGGKLWGFLLRFHG